MESKDYNLVASAISQVKDKVGSGGMKGDVVDQVAKQLAASFMFSDRCFKTTRFLSMCGVKGKG